MSIIINKIAQELNVNQAQVAAAVNLLDEGSTVPFIARYRKEATGGLDDTQLRLLEERLAYLRELEERRAVILKSIEEQQKLTPELRQAIEVAETKTRLEDLYLPYKPKRRTKAQIAREAGLEPLAMALWQDPSQDPEALAAKFLNAEAEIADTKMALEGARHILMEIFSEHADLLDKIREHLWNNAHLVSAVVSGKEQNGKKYADYFKYHELIKIIPSHRALALFRGRREGFLQLALELPDDTTLSYGEGEIAQNFNISDQQRAADMWLKETVRMTWKAKLFPKLELELLTRLREIAEEEAIKVFAENLRDLLLAAPAGSKVTMGLDPGIRTGVKVVVIDNTGKVLDYTTVYPLQPQNEWHPAIAELAKLAAKYNVELISIGNGTGSRETDRLVAELMKMYPDLALKKIVVNEAGASVYSASEYAAQEFPELDVTIRGAVSIARRLQDPLAELVKIEPKAIGVGQYQHDVNQVKLGRMLESVVEDCVNAVGVDVNTASAALLSRVAGLNESLAKNIVEYRNEHGQFKERQALNEVARMGDKSFQQAAGFLRIMQGSNPLDASAVHPEAYPLVEKILKTTKLELKQIIGNGQLLKALNAEDYTDGDFGLPTVLDVLKELDKPGRDPRPEFKTAEFTAGVEAIEHLKTGMILEGVVSNVTNFGAFIDIGVHQDGLVHISAMTDKFITDPRKVVKAGDVVKVKVLEVDLERRRIGLSMKLQATVAKPTVVATKNQSQGKPKKQVKTPLKEKSAPTKAVFNSAMADALAKLKVKE